MLTVRAAFAEGVLLETLVLSVLNHDSAIASAAARMVGRRVRAGRASRWARGARTREAAVAAARAASLVGFASSSNLEAGRRYGVPDDRAPARTPSRCCTTTRRRPSARRSPTLGAGTTLLVDTYDVEQGIRTAVEVAGPELGAHPAGLRRPADAGLPRPRAARLPRRHAAPGSS